jgi:ABC-type multidrug transport system ATPase subunit
MAEAPSALDARALRKEYGPKVAVRELTLSVPRGEVFGFLGPNGAGKTTFLRLVAGILDSSSGTVHLGGVPLDDVREVLARWVGYLPQDFGLPGELTAREYLEYWAVLYEIPEEDRAERVGSLLEEVGLGERSDDRIGSFSGGMRQRVAVARTLLRLPPVIIVDEPTVGLDPRERIRFRNLLSRLARGRVVLFSTHVVEDVAVACQRVVVLARGRLVFDGDPTQLADHARGKVWEVRLLAEERADLPDAARVVDEVPEAGGMVRLRILSDKSPHAAATAVDPTLEDGYFVLAGSRRASTEDAA